MAKKRRKSSWRAWLLAAIVTLVSALLVLIYLRGRSAALPTLAEAIARAANRSPDRIRPNLPPVDGRYPGTVLVEPAPGQAFPIRRAFRPDAATGTLLDLAARETSLASGLLQGKLAATGAVAASSCDIELTIELAQLRILEIDLGREF